MSLTPMEQLIAFVEVERKHYPNKKHVAEWALGKLYEADNIIAQQKDLADTLQANLSAAQARESMLTAIIKDIATNYDHDGDAYKYGTPCRVCEV